VTDRLYEEQAQSWIHWARSDHDSYWIYREFFFELLPAPGELTLEIGCGEGRVARDLRGRGHSVVGIDVSPTLLAAAREADHESDYRLADAAGLPFEDGSFDLVVSYNSLMDMDDMRGAVREASRVLRPGGTFCICVTHPINDAGRFENTEPGARFLMSMYRGRRRYDEWFERGDAKIRCVYWYYPLEGYTRALEDAGFLIEAFREPPVDKSRFAPRGERRLRIPNFLLIRTVKPA
jgi:SAM-dependent methyltransferase